MQRSAVAAGAPAAAPGYVANLNAGRPLDGATRAFFEPRFGHDFSRVRVHDDASAAASARSVNAVAYTSGRDVVFGVGRFAPGTDAGKHLLAHELAHVVQQEAGPVDGTPAFHGVQLSDPSDRFEREADRVADQILRRKDLPANHASRPPRWPGASRASAIRSIQRQPEQAEAPPQPGATPQPGPKPGVPPQVDDAEPMQALKAGVCNHPHAACSAADNLSGEQVVCAAKRAGFTGAALKTAVALAKAESGWDRCCFSSTADVGLWQINQIHWNKFGGRDAVYDADTNAQAAFAVSSSGKSFKPWSAFNNGSYKKFLTEAQQAIDAATCDAKSDGGKTENSEPPTGE